MNLGLVICLYVELVRHFFEIDGISWHNELWYSVGTIKSKLSKHWAQFGLLNEL